MEPPVQQRLTAQDVAAAARELAPYSHDHPLWNDLSFCPEDCHVVVKRRKLKNRTLGSVAVDIVGEQLSLDAQTIDLNTIVYDPSAAAQFANSALAQQAALAAQLPQQRLAAPYQEGGGRNPPPPPPMPPANEKSVPWSSDEDAVVAYIHSEHGRQHENYTLVGEVLGRTPNAVKCRWHAAIKARVADMGPRAASEYQSFGMQVLTDRRSKLNSGMGLQQPSTKPEPEEGVTNTTPPPISAPKQMHAPTSAGRPLSAGGAERDKRGLYRGVFEEGVGRYRSSLGVQSRVFRLGVYETAYEAARAYDKGALQTRGANAQLNFPVEKEQYMRELKAERMSQVPVCDEIEEALASMER
ncbi:ethylene-responsive transcription factor [Pycnococcus provasolii]